MPPSGYRYYTRRWLNHPGYHAGAYVLALVDGPGGSGSLTIADCNRLIRLDFDTYSPGARKNTLCKIDVLIKTLIDMRAALTASKPDRVPQT